MLKFGLSSTDLQGTASTLASVLNVTFVLHESDSRGGDYFRYDSPLGTLFLKHNHDLIDDEPFETDWPVRQLVLYPACSLSSLFFIWMDEKIVTGTLWSLPSDLQNI